MYAKKVTLHGRKHRNIRKHEPKEPNRVGSVVIDFFFKMKLREGNDLMHL